MARIVVAGAGAAGASVAYHLAELGAEDVVLCDRDSVAGGATAKAMGGVRQQFSTPAEVRLAQASIRFFQDLGAPFFDQVGYLFLATTAAGFAELEERAELQRSLGVPVVAAEAPAGVHSDDVVGAVVCWEDGVADPPAVARELVRRAAERGVEVREGQDADGLDTDLLVIAAGPWSAELGRRVGVELPVRPLCRQLLETGPIVGLPADLPMTIEAETGFHFRRRGDRLVLAMADPKLRWGFDEVVDETLFEDRLGRLVHRYPAAVGARVDRAWAGLYDMTPDAHPILGRVGEGIYAACGFSGHGFMQSPAAGRAVAEEILGLEPSFDLSPYRLDRFERGAIFPEQLVL
ncbi:MAG: FAD-binding oxidoreductase [Actinobacteria bacterium]|nr:MAG: FAD-binding oxidoreductase [Actinomycetota bacterium]